MSLAGWTAVALSDLPRVPGRWDIECLLLEHALRLSAFGTIMFVAPIEGEELIGLHDETGEDGQEELYLVLVVLWVCAPTEQNREAAMPRLTLL